MIALLTTDSASSRRQEAFQRQQALKRAQRAEDTYARKLRGVATEIGRLARALHADPPLLQRQLRRYSEFIGPWAEAAAASMVLDVAARDEKAWFERAKQMSRDIRAEIRSAPTGVLVRKIMAEQVAYIKSMPLDAARRVHLLAIRTLETGGRPEELRDEILKSRHVSIGKANLIARTEVGRASTAMVQARSTHVGSEGYIWRTAKDRDVRPEHKKLEGKFCRWDSPPVTSADGSRHHPGEDPNCRCFPEVVLPDF